MSEIILIANQYRDNMLSTNLYTPNNVYDIDGENINNIISTIGQTIIGGSFDFSNSILGRLTLPNTPIQQIGNRELAKALAKRVSSQLLQNVVGSINIDNLSYNEPNYWVITQSDLVNDNNTINFKTLLDILFGYQTLSNPLSGDYSNSNLIETLGKGTKSALESNINNNDYIINSTPYSMGKSELSILNDGNVLDENFVTDNVTTLINNSTITEGYPSSNGSGDLNKIGNSINYDSLAYNSKYKDIDGFWVYDPKSDGTNISSKGSGVLNSNNRFCRTWNLNKRYSTYANLVKFDNTKNLNLKLNSVQGNNILPNIHPDRDSVKRDGYVKNLMFSIENLAYSTPDLKDKLKPSEKGKYGKIMWFPPYNLQFTESVSPKTNSIDMIGRNEPMYTYNGVERTVNISFSLIVDSPSEIRDFSDSNNEFARLFSGCKVSLKNTQKGLSDSEKRDIELKILELSKPDKVVVNQAPSNPYPKNNGMKFYFSNDKYIYGNDINGPIEDDENKTGEKSNVNFINNIDSLVKFMLTDEGSQNFKIVFRGYASKLNDSAYNKVLGYLRAYSVYTEVVNRIKGNDDNGIYNDNSLDFSVQVNPKTGLAVVPSDRVEIKTYSNNRIRIETYGESKAKNTVSTKYTLNEDVIDRYCEVYLEKTLDNVKKTDTVDSEQLKNNQAEIKRLEEILSNNNDNILQNDFYFEKLKKSDPLIFNLFKDKVKYYAPVFNSQTPEDFNSRLVFLHQCTRQGSSQSSDVDNSIFGKPPVSILRIGDFFHSKIIINSFVINYEPLIWDLNPEGIGIQPMLANVTLDCYVIGGQSLDGPMKRLLNALDTNFYANTQMYDKKASDVASEYFKTDSSLLDRYTSINNTIASVVNSEPLPKSQIDRANLTNLSSQASLKTAGSDIGNNQLNYNSALEYQADILNNWSSFLYQLPNDYKKYITNGILSNNSFINNENPSDVEKDNFIKISGELLNISMQYSLYDLKTIASTGIDNNKTITQNSEFDKFVDIVNNMEEFKSLLNGDSENKTTKIVKAIKNLNNLTYG